MPRQKGIKVLCQNKKARHDYFIEDTLECGIELVGTEVKSIRNGQANLKDCYVQVKNGELIVYGMHVSPYEQGNQFNHDPFRNRRLLAHRREITKLQKEQQQEAALNAKIEKLIAEEIAREKARIEAEKKRISV